MKLVRYGSKDAEKPGLIDAQGHVRDLSAHCDDIDGTTLSSASLAKLEALYLQDLPPVEGKPRLGIPVNGIGKVVGIGLNYQDHAEELGAPIPSEPILFLKATTSLTGPSDDIILPSHATHADWEVELAIIIGERARSVPEVDALAYVAGFSTFLDVSERHYQNERGGQWTKGKSFDTFGPLGPWMVTKDEVEDPQLLGLWLDVDGRRKQFGNTELMIFSAQFIVHYVSQVMTLEPGDVIATGTPPGVGHGMTPPEYLRAGNRVELGVDKLGQQSHFVIGSD